MSNKNFVNFHIITSHSVSNLNRDDMGLQKTALFGGKKRTRISSQCEKRALRTSKYYNKNIGEASIRTRELGSLLVKSIEKLGNKYSEDIITNVIERISGEKNLTTETSIKTVAAWAISEIGEYCKIYTSLKEKSKDDKEFEKLFKKKTDVIKDKGSTAFNQNFEDGIDIALSGRMATSGIMSNVDAALAVAQAITTHTTQSDIDWFTAVDDLSKTGGSAHLDSQEFGAGVFYKYASLNISLLQKNLGECSREKAFEIAAHTLHMLATVSPSAKQNSYAAFNPADFVMVTVGDQPISLANAFETPVVADRKGGFLTNSVKGFSDYKTKLFEGYGLDDKCAVFSLADGFEAEATIIKSLKELKEWLQNA